MQTNQIKGFSKLVEGEEEEEGEEGEERKCAQTKF